MRVYYLCGFLNLHAVFPAFVYPVFKAGHGVDRYYLEDGEDTIIHSFNEIPKNNLLGFYKCSKELANQNKRYAVGDKTVYAFMESSDGVVYGDISHIISFISDYKGNVTDQLLRQEIDDFLRDITLKDSASHTIKKQASVLANHNSHVLRDLEKEIMRELVLLSKSKTDFMLNFNCLNVEKPFWQYFAELCDLSYRCQSITLDYFRERKDWEQREEELKKYKMLVDLNKTLMVQFKNISNRYASVLLEKSFETSHSNNIDADEFIRRMLVKKTWLLPEDQLQLFYERYLNSFPDILPESSIDTVSVEELVRAQEQLLLENETLKRLIIFLLDVLDDSGVYQLRKKLIDMDM